MDSILVEWEKVNFWWKRGLCSFKTNWALPKYNANPSNSNPFFLWRVCIVQANTGERGNGGMTLRSARFVRFAKIIFPRRRRKYPRRIHDEPELSRRFLYYYLFIYFGKSIRNRLQHTARIRRPGRHDGWHAHLTDRSE